MHWNILKSLISGGGGKNRGGQKVTKNAVENLFINIVNKKISWPLVVLKLFLFYPTLNKCIIIVLLLLLLHL